MMMIWDSDGGPPDKIPVEDLVQGEDVLDISEVCDLHLNITVYAEVFSVLLEDVGKIPEKDEEYRNERILTRLRRNTQPKYVTFYRGYTNITVTLEYRGYKILHVPNNYKIVGPYSNSFTRIFWGPVLVVVLLGRVLRCPLQNSKDRILNQVQPTPTRVKTTRKIDHLNLVLSPMVVGDKVSRTKKKSTRDIPDPPLSPISTPTSTPSRVYPVDELDHLRGSIKDDIKKVVADLLKPVILQLQDNKPHQLPSLPHVPPPVLQLPTISRTEPSHFTPIANPSSHPFPPDLFYWQEVERAQKAEADARAIERQSQADARAAEQELMRQRHSFQARYMYLHMTQNRPQ